MREFAIGMGIAACLGMACPQMASLALAGPEEDTVASFRLLKFDGHYVKWGNPMLGTGAQVTYAFVNEPMRFEGARNCSSLTAMGDLSARFGISRATLEKETMAAFRVWQEAANIAFVAVDNPDQADILIGAQAKPVGRAYTNVAYRSGSGKGVNVIDKALICLNPEQPWKVGFDGDTDIYDIRYTIAHEIGHAIGLDHPSPFGQMMSFQYNEKFRDLQAGDLKGVAALYGESGASYVAGDPRNGPDVGPARHEYSLR